MIRKIVCSIAVILAPMSLFGYNNYISGDPFLPFFGTVQFHYERAILKKMSVEIGLGRKFNSGIFELSGINTSGIFINDLNLSGIKILPEVRYYLTKQDSGLTGFYTGIYYKYQTNFSHLTGTYTDKNNYTTDVNLDLKIISNTYGIEIGYKLKIYKRARIKKSHELNSGTSESNIKGFGFRLVHAHTAGIVLCVAQPSLI